MSKSIEALEKLYRGATYSTTLDETVDEFKYNFFIVKHELQRLKEYDSMSKIIKKALERVTKIDATDLDEVQEALLFISPLVEGIDYKYRLKIQNLLDTLKGKTDEH